MSQLNHPFIFSWIHTEVGSLVNEEHGQKYWPVYTLHLQELLDHEAPGAQFLC